MRSRSGNADLSLLRSFVLSAAGGHGANYAPVTGYDRGYPNAAAGYSAGMSGQHNAIGLGGPSIAGALAGSPFLGHNTSMGPAGAAGDMALPSGSLYVPGGKGNRWTGWAQTSVGHFSSAGPGAAVVLTG